MTRFRLTLVALLFSFLLGSPIVVHAQQDDTPSTSETDVSPFWWSSLTVHLHTGYTSFAMNEASDFMHTVADLYQAQGINVPVQQTYPGNTSYGLEVMLDGAYPGVTAGTHVQYSQTEAFGLYGDYAGTLDLTSQVSLWTIETSLAYTFLRTRPLRPFVGARGGLAVGRYRFTESINITFDDLDETSEFRLDGNGIGPVLGAFGGARYVFGRMALRSQVGYRYAVMDPKDDSFPFRLDYSGPTVGLGVEMRVAQ